MNWEKSGMSEIEYGYDQDKDNISKYYYASWVIKKMKLRTCGSSEGNDFVSEDTIWRKTSF